MRAALERFLCPSLGTCGRCNRPWKAPAVRRLPDQGDGIHRQRQLPRLRYWGLVGVEPHSTPYDDGDVPPVLDGLPRMWVAGRSCFPLCEGCWAALTPLERLPFYRALWERWLRDALERGDDVGTEWRPIQQAVLAGL